MIGVYVIENTVNGKVYVGKTTRPFDIRLKEHLRDLKRNKHHSKHLQQSFNYYGENKFLFDILEVIENTAILDEREKFWINYYDSSNKKFGYNMTLGGDGGGIPTEETRQKMSRDRTGKKRPQISKAKTGVKRPAHSIRMKGVKRPNHSEIMKGSKNPSSKLNDNDISVIKKLLENGTNYKDIMSLFNIGRSTVYNIKNNKNFFKNIKGVE